MQKIDHFRILGFDILMTQKYKFGSSSNLKFRKPYFMSFSNKNNLFIKPTKKFYKSNSYWIFLRVSSLTGSRPLRPIWSFIYNVKKLSKIRSRTTVSQSAEKFRNIFQTGFNAVRFFQSIFASKSRGIRSWREYFWLQI